MAREFRDLKTLAEARKALWRVLPERIREGRYGGRSVDTAEAVGLCLNEAIHTPMDLPPFDRATVDGYAVRAQDTFGASEGLPAYLQVIGEVGMGDVPEFALAGGQAARVPTGGMLPKESDAAVMIEQTQPWGGDSIEILRPVGPGENVVHRGDDLRAGGELFPAGHRLRPQDIAALAGLGVSEVEVRRPRVAVVSTGDELVASEAALEPGKIYDMNGPGLRAAVCALGGEAIDLGVVADDRQAICEALRRGLAEADVVLASGGTSVGPEDLMPEIINGLGRPGVLVHGLAVKPGKPVVIGLVGEVPVFGLPGHPTSALVIFRELVAPLLGAATGRSPTSRSTVRACLARNVASQAGRQDFVRVRLEESGGECQAVPLLGPSALISTLIEADGLIRVPAAAEGLYAGDMVDVELLT